MKRWFFSGRAVHGCQFSFLAAGVNKRKNRPRDKQSIFHPQLTFNVAGLHRRHNWARGNVNIQLHIHFLSETMYGPDVCSLRLIST